MLLLLVLLQALLLLLVGALLLKYRTLLSNTNPEEVPAQLGRLEDYVREAFALLRRDAPEEAARSRRESAERAAELRREVIGSVAQLGEALQGGLSGLRQDQGASALALRNEVDQKMRSISQGFADLRQETEAKHAALRESLSHKLTELMGSNTTQQDKLRETVQARLDNLSKVNHDKLEEMRATVDEKLHATLHSRLTESFGQVTDQLNKVHGGLGEMSKLSAGVSDLSRIFTNVKTRGGFGEARLDMLLQNMLAASEYVHNASCRPNSREMVEFAIRFPGGGGERTLLPIDSKFPCEVWERLEAAYDASDADRIASAGREFESALRAEARKICEKYINPPITTPHAIMFLPTEGLYAEVMRRDALQAEIQSKYQVTIAGPATLCAILTSFRMGFHMLALQEKGDEVWKVLERAKSEFKTFEGLMGTMEKQVGTVQNTIQKLGIRTRAINRSLRDVSETEEETNELAFAAPLRLVANGDEA